MTTALTTIAPRLPMPALGEHDIDAGRWRVLCETIFPNAKSPGSIVMALDYCRARGLDPWKKPVHIVPVWNSALNREVETVWPSINEIEITAARTNAWAGLDPPQWGPLITKKFIGTRYEDRQPVDVEVELEFPEWCAVTVYRLVGGVRCAFTEPVYWLESYARVGGKTSKLPNDTWQRRVRSQLGKVAKAASLRAAFPEESDYTAEEMEGQDIADVPLAPRTPEPPAPVTINTPQAAPVEAAEPVLPHEIFVEHHVDGTENWLKFGQQYIAAIRAAKSLNEADEWAKFNEKTLADMLAKAPKVRSNLMGAVSKVRAELFTAAQQPEPAAPDQPQHAAEGA